MKVIPVQSTGIESVGYDLDSQILTVVFRKGPVYRYLDVPERVYRGLLTAASVMSSK